ncbi:CocE/NonD family hydrolase [Ottowia sp. VDI28]|uniref:CocE/NonD family hydrolase n=1 Tax=Ottowia sp. VDI28 TaxID=3133968 RepID=UPI003C2BFA20
MFRGLVSKARDGTRLTADLYLPPGDELRAYPTLLERTPYGRHIPRFRDFGSAAASAGYAYAVQDTRGRGDSGGVFHLMTNTPDEGEDGIDTWNWLREQPWCDGDRMGMVGGSFSAANQQALALHHPRGLRAQVLRDAGTNYRHRMFRYHGAYNIGVALPWAITHGLELALQRGDAQMIEALEDMRDRSAQWIDMLPLKKGESPLRLAPAYEEIYFRMLQESDDTPYWHNPTVRLEGRWDEYPTDVAIFLISGWFAHHANANLDKLRELGGRSHRPVKLVMGPWVHSPQMLELTTAGEADFGPAAAEQGPVTASWLNWLDNHLKDAHPPEKASEPALKYFVMGLGDGHRTPEGRIFHGGEWRAADSWPLKTTIATPYYLDAGGGLSPERPAPGSASLSYLFNPDDPCPGIGASSLQSEAFPNFVLPGPRDQRCRPSLSACRGSDRPLSERSDVLVFQTKPLAEPCEITGPLELELWVSSTARDTDFTAKFIDVYPPSDEHPEGAALMLSEGIVRMRYRDGRATGELIEPGRPYRVVLELNPTSNLFKRGHRIRIDVSSSSFPQYDVNPNTGEPLGAHTHTVVAEQTVYMDGLRASHIVLPIQPSTAH